MIKNILKKIMNGIMIVMLVNAVVPISLDARGGGWGAFGAGVGLGLTAPYWSGGWGYPYGYGYAPYYYNSPVVYRERSPVIISRPAPKQRVVSVRNNTPETIHVQSNQEDRTIYPGDRVVIQGRVIAIAVKGKNAQRVTLRGYQPNLEVYFDRTGGLAVR